MHMRVLGMSSMMTWEVCSLCRAGTVISVCTHGGILGKLTGSKECS